MTRKQPPDLDGKVVVVTGASSGIGRAFVERAACPGSRFALLARRGDLLESLADAVRGRGGEALVQPVDLRDADAARTAAEEALAEFGPPDVVVANAGLSIARSVAATAARPDSITRSVAANFTGPVAHALPLLEAMRGRGAGHLIGSSTANARLTIPGWGPYVASKSAWDAWLRTAAAELAPHGIAVTILAFPLVATDMSRPTLTGRRAMSAGDAADWISEAIGSRRPRIAPWWLRAAEVANAVAPTALARAIGRSSQRLSQP